MSLTPPESTTSTPTMPSNLTESPSGISLTNADDIKKFNELPEIKALVDWARQEHQRAKAARGTHEKQWRLNIAMYQGRQNVAFLANGVQQGKLVVPPAPPWRVRSVTNRIRPIIRTEFSRVTQNKPSATVVPASSEDKDLMAAQAAEQVWQSEYVNKKLMRVYGRMAWWMLLTGTGFIKTWWDSGATSKYALSARDEQGNPLLAQGDTMYSHVTPFHLFVPDLREEEIENQPFVINTFVKPVEWVKQKYGRDFKADIAASNEIIEDSTLGLTGGDTQPDSVLILEVWVKPGGHRLFPNGGYFCVISNKVVTLYDQMLYDHGEYPFTKFEHIPTGSFYADSVINDLIAPQREYNRTRSQMIESKNRMAKPQLMAPEGSVDPQKITTEPGQVILFKPGFGPPQPLPLQPIPSYVSQELDIVIRDMEDISSQHEVSRGETPGSVTAATAISFLQERDDGPMAHTYQSIEAGWEKIARQSLSHTVQFWDLERIVRTTGTDGSFDALMLKGSDLKNGTDLRMEPGSSLPQSKAARQAFIMDMMKMGFIPPERGLEMMEIGGTQRIYEELKIDERQAQRENLRMQNLDINMVQQYKQEQEMQFQDQQVVSELLTRGMNGESAGLEDIGMDPANINSNTGMLQVPPLNMVPVNSWDNHVIHIEVHNKFRKSQAFENLPDLIKEQFEAHVRAHADALNMAGMGAQFMQDMQGGTGGDPNAMFPESQGNQPPNPQGNNQFGPSPAGQGPNQMEMNIPQESGGLGGP